MIKGTLRWVSELPRTTGSTHRLVEHQSPPVCTDLGVEWQGAKVTGCSVSGARGQARRHRDRKGGVLDPH